MHSLAAWDELDALGEPKDAKKFAQAILAEAGHCPGAKQIRVHSNHQMSARGVR